MTGETASFTIANMKLHNKSLGEKLMSFELRMQHNQRPRGKVSMRICSVFAYCS
jgi:hypothetical protein